MKRTPNHSMQRMGASRSAQSAFVAQWRLAPTADADRSPMHAFMRHLACLNLILVLASVAANAADRSYYDRFNGALTAGQRGFLSDSSLIDTNNSGPIHTNAPIRFSKLRESGELGGIRLGMCMSEVVAAWGKPQRLFTHCVIGPRLYYGREVSLFFRGDRLVLIGVAYDKARQLTFDNGLSGQMGRGPYEKVLGPPSLQIEDRRGIFVGEIAYQTNGLRTDFLFESVKERDGATAVDRVVWIAVRLEAETEQKTKGELDGASNGSQPIRSETNRTSSAAGSRR